MAFKSMLLVGFLTLAIPMAFAHDHKTTPEVGDIQSVLVSIHPMALLVKSAWPQLSVQTLVKANQSPHDFTLKPSHIKAIKEANAVIWLGPKFEPYLIKPLKGGKVQVDLSVFDSHDHHHHDHGDHHDPHLWLQPDLIEEVLLSLQSQLNLPKPERFLKLYNAWLAVARIQMSDKAKTGFVSYHDAFSGWVKYFALNELAIMTSNPEKPVGTFHVLKVRHLLKDEIAKNKTACLFVEPQFQGRLLNKLKADLDVRLVQVDPIASQYEVKNANFLDFYNETLTLFSKCLKP